MTARQSLAKQENVSCENQSKSYDCSSRTWLHFADRGHSIRYCLALHSAYSCAYYPGTFARKKIRLRKFPAKAWSRNYTHKEIPRRPSRWYSGRRCLAYTRVSALSTISLFWRLRRSLHPFRLGVSTEIHTCINRYFALLSVPPPQPLYPLHRRQRRLVFLRRSLINSPSKSILFFYSASFLSNHFDVVSFDKDIFSVIV